ncbi:YhdP family phospholipid transporter [Zymobacter palmae]|uniref:Predicted membrane protein n=1 Tax=Zymobacter palmae TaxID=33074 RepID=A0A348HGX6_9GAMM|nr:AsmA-like C-terminal region-containing protein [Zymobacter palmae]BBG30878.1 predicted membrane protein [Zymobacter palmae]
MRVSRILLRCGLALIASLVLIIVLLLVSLHVAPWHFRDVDLASWRRYLPIPEQLDGHADELVVSLKGSTLGIQVSQLTLEDAFTHRQAVSLAQADAQLDLWHAMTGGAVVSALHASQPHIALQQQSDGQWLLISSSSKDDRDDAEGLSWDRIDQWLEQLRPADVAIDDLRVTLQGLQRTMVFELPSLSSSHSATGDVHWQAAIRQQGDDAALAQLALATTSTRGVPWQMGIDVDGRQAGELLTLLGSGRHYQVGLQGSVRLAATWADHRLHDASAAVDIPSFMVLREDVVPRQWATGRLALNGQLHWNGQAWQGQLQDMLLQHRNSKNALGPSQLPSTATLKGDAHSLVMQFPTFDITDLSMVWPMLPSSAGLRSGLTQLNPRGHVAALSLTFDGTHGISVGAQLQQARVSGWDNIPVLGPFDGQLQTDTRNGTLDVSLAPGATFFLPSIFPREWTLSQGHARLAWQRENDSDWRLKIDPIDIVREGATLQGALSLWAPDRGEGAFSMTLDAQNAVVKDSRDWLPTQALPPALGEWLATNIHRGRVNRAHIALSMPLEDELAKLERPLGAKAEHHLSSDLSFDLQDVELAYLPGWPALTNVAGHLDYRDERMVARIDSATLLGLVGRQAEARYADDRLIVHSPVTGDTGALLRVLKQAALSPSLKKTIAPWQARGPLQATLDVDVPFEDGKPIKVEASGRIQRGQLDIQPHDLNIRAIEGTARFSLIGDQTRLTADAKGSAFGGPAHATLAFKDADGDIRVEGKADAQVALDWLAFRGLAPDTRGQTSYRALLEIGDVTRLLIDSTLEGVTLPLPAPLGKSADEAAPLKVDMDLTHGDGSALIDRRLWARWRNDMTQGQLWVEHWPLVRQPWDDSPGWTVHWTTPRVAIDEWMPAIKALDMTAVGHQDSTTSTSEGSAAAPAIRRLLVDTPCIALNQQCLGQVRLSGNADEKGLWRIDATGNLINGRLTWLPGSKDQFDLALDTLSLDGITGLMQSERQQEGHELTDEVFVIPRPHVDPVALPETLENVPNGTLSIAKILLKGQAVGDLTAHWQTAADMLSLDNMRLAFKGSVLNMSGRWMKAGKASVTQGKAHLDLGDFAELLAAFGQPEVVHTTEGGTIDMAFAWPGAPWQPTLGTATGSLDTDVKAGRFMSIDSTSVRMVGLLNLNNILRRLRLDFTDVIHSGTAFNSIKGSGTFSDGILITRRPIEIDAAVTHFSADGQVDLLQRTVNQRVGVTVPVMQGLPIAALLTGLPQLGAVLLGTNWLFGDQFNQLTELHYRVEGSWDAPTFTLETTH